MGERKQISIVYGYVLVVVVVLVSFLMVRDTGIGYILGIDGSRQKWTVNGVEGGNERFEISYVQARAGEKIKIIRDKETGMSYLFVQDGEGAGMVPMNMKVELVNDLLKTVTKGR